jgi:hypothetical protein
MAYFTNDKRTDRKPNPDRGMWFIFAIIYAFVALIYLGVRFCI